MSKVYKDISELMGLSIEGTTSEELDCDIALIEEGKQYRAYAVNVAYRELGFFTDKGYISYMVDTYGATNTIELYEIEE